MLYIAVTLSFIQKRKYFIKKSRVVIFENCIVTLFLFCVLLCFDFDSFLAIGLLSRCTVGR